MEDRKLTVVLVSYNSSGIIGRALSSLAKFNDLGNSLEVIVVNNAGSDINELRREISAAKIPVKLLEADRNGGYGAGNNLGIAAASAPYIIIMNPDVELVKPIFSKIVNAFDTENALGLLGLRQYEKYPTVQGKSFIINWPSWPLLIIYRFALILNWFTPRWFCFSGACFGIRKAAFEEAGKFNEDIFLYGEETDLQYRLLRKANASKIVYRKDLAYIHELEYRQHDIDAYLEGAKSYLVIAKTRGIDSLRMKKTLKRYYGFLKSYAGLRRDLVTKHAFKKLLHKIDHIQQENEVQI